MSRFAQAYPDDSYEDLRDRLAALADRYREDAKEKGDYVKCISCSKVIIGDTYCFKTFTEPLCYKCYHDTKRKIEEKEMEDKLNYDNETNNENESGE
jgi:hypothetical protein